MIHDETIGGNDSLLRKRGQAEQASRSGRKPLGLLDRLASVRLTLWLLGGLAGAMAVATVIPQRAPAEAYLKVFGTLLGPLVAHTSLQNVYGSWWFIGAFALLAVNLLACSIRRATRLLTEAEAAPTLADTQRVRARGHGQTWHLAKNSAQATGAVASALRQQGYRVLALPGEEPGRLGVFAQRGRLTPWASVLVHVGMVVILVGAGWGRLPRNAYQGTAMLRSGEDYPVTIPGQAFSLRLLGAGARHDAKGQPTDYWARAQVLEEGAVVRTATIRPNHPLRYAGVSVVLQGLLPGGYAVEVSRKGSRSLVPVVFSQEGTVDMMATVTRLQDPPWIVFLHDFRDGGEGQAGPAAQVFADRSGHLSHDWQRVGWVDEQGLDFAGAHFRLVPDRAGAQLSLDRDVGVPIVWAGFLVIALGALLVLGTPRRVIEAACNPHGKGTQVVVGGAGTGVKQDLERIFARLEAGEGARHEANSKGKDGSHVR